VQHFRDFKRFEMNKRDLDCQRENRILVAEEILHEIENQPRTTTRRNYSLFTLLLKPLLFSENELEAHFVNLC
jgi:hypothetical protein